LSSAPSTEARPAPSAAPPAVATAFAARATGRRAAHPVWHWLRVLGGVGILALLVWQVGTGPFLHGLASVSGQALLFAFAVGLVSTISCALRWKIVASGLGVWIPLRSAIADYYRAQFLNMTLPGGVFGDVHRAVRHGMDIGDVKLGVRAVALERLSGAAVQIAIGVVALLAFPSPVRAYMPLTAVAVAVAAVAIVLLARKVLSDVRRGVLAGRRWIGVVGTTAIVLSGHVSTFVVAARTAGYTLATARLVPLLLLALLAMGLPLNIAGWGPREGVAAWAFAAAGLTATQGVTVSVTYGVLVFVAGLPGAAVLLTRWLHRTFMPPTPVFGVGDSHG
jgi:glycosyltransferase 2 family protein